MAAPPASNGAHVPRVGRACANGDRAGGHRAAAREVAQAAGAADAAVAIWSLARWPLIFCLVVLATAGLYKLAPRKRRPGVRAVSVGSVAAVLVWLLSSVGFEVWVVNFADYDATYGALAGAVAFAFWLWISNLALLFGMMLDLELSPAPEGGGLG